MHLRLLFYTISTLVKTQKHFYYYCWHFTGIIFIYVVIPSQEVCCCLKVISNNTHWQGTHPTMVRVITLSWLGTGEAITWAHRSPLHIRWNHFYTLIRWSKVCDLLRHSFARFILFYFAIFRNINNSCVLIVMLVPLLPC